jgi:hypothetical protein
MEKIKCTYMQMLNMKIYINSVKIIQQDTHINILDLGHFFMDGNIFNCLSYH